MPGQSGNPGGRPKSLAATILEECPTVSADLVRFWLLIAFGTATEVQRRCGVRPRLQDRFYAASELADRLHGRPAPTVEIEEHEPDVPAFILPPGSKVRIT